MYTLLFLLFFTVSMASLPAGAAGEHKEPEQSRTTLNGYISDEETGETLLGANVLVTDTDRGATTNHAGYYIINNVPPGS